jgi:acetyl-CoA carboxylase carboxyl transferase subunit beta
MAGYGRLDGLEVTAAAQDFSFMGGSLGMAAGEAVVKSMLKAVELETPFIMFAASGGARMQEGMLSLMQMPRTTVGVQRLREARLPYIVVLTHPTTGGVTASYAMLGDIHIAEPGALICFAGPRVIEQTIREKLPEGFQRAEYLFEHGMIDVVVHRHQLRETLRRCCHTLMSGRRPKARLNNVKPHSPSGHGPSGEGEAGPKARGGIPLPVLQGELQTQDRVADRAAADKVWGGPGDPIQGSSEKEKAPPAIPS